MSDLNSNSPSDSAATNTGAIGVAAPSNDRSVGALTIAGLWAAAALGVGIYLLANAKGEEYGGDAYTGIQNAVVLAVQGIAWVLFGSGALGLVIALRRSPK